MWHGIYHDEDAFPHVGPYHDEDAFPHVGPWAVDNWFSNGHNSQAHPLLSPRNNFGLMQVQVKINLKSWQYVHRWRELYCKKAVVWVGSTCKHLHKPIEMKTLSSPGYCRTHS
jgi:hypothetical protein